MSLRQHSCTPTVAPFACSSVTHNTTQPHKEMGASFPPRSNARGRAMAADQLTTLCLALAKCFQNSMRNNHLCLIRLTPNISTNEVRRHVFGGTVNTKRTLSLSLQCWTELRQRLLCLDEYGLALELTRVSGGCSWVFFWAQICGRCCAT